MLISDYQQKSDRHAHASHGIVYRDATLALLLVVQVSLLKKQVHQRHRKQYLKY